MVFLKNIFALILLVSFALQSFHRSFMIADYYANNHSYIEKCENKSKPSLHCDGKCVLMKKMQKEENKDQQNPERKAENKQDNILSSKSFFPTIVFSSVDERLSFSPLLVKETTTLPRMILRPPIG